MNLVMTAIVVLAVISTLLFAAIQALEIFYSASSRAGVIQAL